MAIFKGAGVAIVTPMYEDGKVNYDKLEELLEYQIANSTDAIIICGTTGESSTMTHGEHLKTIKFAIDKVNKRVPVIAGTGSNCTETAIMMSKEAASYGADALLIVTPYYNKATQKGLIAHYTAIAEAVPETPVLLYNNPGRVGYTLSADLVEKLAHEVENIVGMKDTSGDITQTEEFIRRNADVGFKVFGGKDTLLYASLCIGAVGGVCTAGNFMPELIVDIYNKYVAGDIQGSLAAQYKLNPVRLAMDGASFPVAAKDMAIMRGLAAGKPYLPNFPTPEGVSYDKMKKEMEKAGLI